jgi:hypothetical protein
MSEETESYSVGAPGRVYLAIGCVFWKVAYLWLNRKGGGLNPVGTTPGLELGRDWSTSPPGRRGVELDCASGGAAPGQVAFDKSPLGGLQRRISATVAWSRIDGIAGFGFSTADF